jgi:hypothetical protein
MSSEDRIPSQNSVIYCGTAWSFTIRGSELPPRIGTVVDPLQRYAMAGHKEEGLDGAISFHASPEQVAAWHAQADQTGRSFEQIMRYHLVRGVDVRGPDGLVLIMSFIPQGSD